MIFAIAYVLGLVAFVGVWSRKARTDCVTCGLDLDEGSDNRYCVGCLVEGELKD